MTDPYAPQPFESSPVTKSAPPINIKRVLTRAIKFWYLLVLSVLIGLSLAYFINRYTTPVYTVSASIIVREGLENAGAEFLYKSNPLVTPYRNFYNELYIMRSYPLLQEVIEQLNFDVTWYREGNVKTVEVYDTYLPRVQVLQTDTKISGRQLIFRANDQKTFSLEYVTAEGSEGKKFSNLTFNDTLSINGYKLIFRKQEEFPPLFFEKPYTIAFRDSYSLAQLYSERLKATWAEQGASVINLNINGTIPKKEIDFINQFIERYQQYDEEKKNEVATKSIEFLDRQLSNIGDSLKYFDDRIEDFKKGQFTTNFEGEATTIMERVSELDQQLAQLELYANYFKYLEDYLKRSTDFDQIVPPSAVGITDQLLNGLITQLTEVQFGLRMLGDLQTEANPMVTERKQKIQQLKGDVLEGVQSLKSAQAINRAFLEKQLRGEERRLKELPQAERNYFDIKRSYTVRENLYLFLMQKRAEAGISRASTTSDIIVVNPPSQKGEAITPVPLQNYGLGLLIGFIIPVAGFVLAEWLNDKVQSKEDIDQLTNLPVIGGIGHAGEEESLIVLRRPKSAMAEAFRALRSNLNYFTQGEDSKVILITSSVSGEGKTFTTLNLATVMAFSGKRVLIIGADMRKPKLFSDFGLNNEIGLSSYLASLKTLPEVIQKTPVENLDLISGGPIPPNPSELLMLPKLEQMMTQLKEMYDYVLVDSPPIGLVADAFSILPLAHHTIFMVRQNYTIRHHLRDLQILLDQRQISNFSILFNDIKRTGPGYGYGYGKGYGYGYGYGYGHSYGYGDNKKASGGYYQE